MEFHARRQNLSWHTPNRRLRLATCILAAMLCPLASLGCLSLSVGNWMPRAADDPTVLTQSGRAKVALGQIVDIYYPVPYATTPNVELESDVFHNYEIVEQKADHFRLRNINSSFDVNWTARGVRAGHPAIIVQPSAVTTTASPES